MEAMLAIDTKHSLFCIRNTEKRKTFNIKMASENNNKQLPVLVELGCEKVKLRNDAI